MKKTKKEDSVHLPQEITQSYGTGVKQMPNYDMNGKIINDDDAEYTQTSPILTGGDVDAQWQDADAVGDEAVGGSSPTPDQSVTEEIAAAVGVEIDDATPLGTYDMLEQRDEQRWELDPRSN
ncbi:DUF6335 family protein [Calothrix sp. PCC 6303]|uniref:DUF6335 family protein n=1 Tax=Calothrix sp. PCC 6303 TaxID=1170562 RepID=UPI0002A04895|nr:DUF6335 family protein [Calothrix sp. PCC 6303]AFY99966.1 hypothetical protein Cal6303_0902 [Calothrix sp. PCC 6303]